MFFKCLSARIVDSCISMSSLGEFGFSCLVGWVCFLIDFFFLEDTEELVDTTDDSEVLSSSLNFA